MCKHRRDFDMILRGIILSFGDDGATLKDITTTYEKLMYKKLPMHWKTHDELNQYIGLIDNVCMQLRNGGLAVWYVEETDHSSSSETDESTTEEHCNVQLRNKYIPETAASSTSSVLAHMQVAVEVHNQNNSPPIPSTSTDSSDSLTKRQRNVFPTAAPLSQRNVEIHNQNNPSPKPSIERSASTAEKRPASASAPAAQLGQRNVEVHNQSNSSSALSACSPPMAKKRRINVESTPLRQQYVQQHHTSNLPPMPTTSTEYSASNCSTGPSTSDQQPIQSTRESTTAAPCYEMFVHCSLLKEGTFIKVYYFLWFFRLLLLVLAIESIRRVTDCRISLRNSEPKYWFLLISLADRSTLEKCQRDLPI